MTEEYHELYTPKARKESRQENLAFLAGALTVYYQTLGDRRHNKTSVYINDS